MTDVARGRFVTLEGGEGTGKSTQLPLIAAYLRVSTDSQKTDLQRKEIEHIKERQLVALECAQAPFLLRQATVIPSLFSWQFRNVAKTWLNLYNQEHE